MTIYDASDLSTPLLDPYPKSGRGWLAKPWRRLRGFIALIGESLASFASTIWNSVRSDPPKAIHAFKMGLALVLAFLLVLLEAPYEALGSHAIWAIMTVIVVFEFSIGATLSKGLNRGAGTVSAGLLAIVIGLFSRLCGSVGRPIVIGFCVFVIGGVVTFTKLRPALKSYEYGFRTFLLTFSLILVAEYRGGNPLNTAVNRFIVILIGACIGIAVNLFVLPIWSGDELHDFIAKNFDSVADSLEVCVREYLQGTVLERVPSKIFMGLAADDPVYKGYRSALVSANKEETLAGFAGWEYPHGRFRTFKYPWENYVKVGAVLRHCTYSIVALHGCLRSAIQAPQAVRRLLEDELHDVSIEGAAVLRKLGGQIKNMERGDTATILNGVLHAVDRLQQSLYLHSYLLVRQETGILDENMGDLAVSMIPEITRLENNEHSGHLLRGRSTNKLGWAYPHDESSDTSKRNFKKLHSWPARPMDDYDFAKDAMFEQRVRVLESASALSLGTFATLLMEVALRLDYVVEAVEELGVLANFNAEKVKAIMDHKYKVNGNHIQNTGGDQQRV